MKNKKRSLLAAHLIAVAAAAALTAPAAKPDAHQALIKKSVAGPLTDTEQTQLHELATSRAEAAGLLEQPEAQEAGHEGQ